MEYSMVTTAFNLEGYKVVKNLGVVKGITVRSPSYGGMFKGSMQMMGGGQLKIFTDICEKARAEAFELMIKHALEMGANAIIGMRYDATAFQEIATEVLCYGTAVLVEPA